MKNKAIYIKINDYKCISNETIASFIEWKKNTNYKLCTAWNRIERLNLVLCEVGEKRAIIWYFW